MGTPKGRKEIQATLQLILENLQSKLKQGEWEGSKDRTKQISSQDVDSVLIALTLCSRVPREGPPPRGAYRALCTRCAKSWPFSTTGSSVSSEDWKDVIDWLLQWTGL